MTEKYRFDDAYGKVYELNSEGDAYVHIGSYMALGVNADMTYDEAAAAVEQNRQD